MANEQLQSVNPNAKQPEGKELTPHQREILDYASFAAVSANKVQTEEIVVRTRHTVQTEINTAFINYTKLTMGRRIIMVVGAVGMFGLGFLAKGWLGSREMEPTNNVHD